MLLEKSAENKNGEYPRCTFSKGILPEQDEHNVADPEDDFLNEFIDDLDEDDLDEFTEDQVWDDSQQEFDSF